MAIDGREKLMPTARNLATHDVDGRPLRWRDMKGVTHAVELTPAAANDSVGSWRTRCGGWNIDRSESWGGDDRLTCQSCSAIERGI
jgi:hypothetical protein